jgi:hypothetical protein
MEGNYAEAHLKREKIGCTIIRYTYSLHNGSRICQNASPLLIDAHHGS